MSGKSSREQCRKLLGDVREWEGKGCLREGGADSLPYMMALAVPLHIILLKQKGGPQPDDYKKAQETSDMLGERGDVLLCGGGKKGECADLFNRMAHAVAVLAFVPGGVTVFGGHWEVERVVVKEQKHDVD